ncbi:hypothetical protein [Caldimonas caldifontis]|nr:hypothetical protein [Caldimonas caldifontis]
MLKLNLRTFGAFLALGFCVILVVDLTRLPSSQTLHVLARPVVAQAVAFGKGERSVTVRTPEGQRLSLPCNVSGPLCESVRSGSSDLQLEVVRLSVFGDHFAVSARNPNRVLVDAADAAQRLSKVRTERILQLLIVATVSLGLLWFAWLERESRSVNRRSQRMSRQSAPKP